MKPENLADDCFFDRDLSWLSFNDRVLDEAAKSSVPLHERLKFLAIFSSNLDEFYRVRFPVLLAAKQIIQKKDNKAFLHLPDAEHAADIISSQQEKFGKLLVNELLPALHQHNIQLVYNQPIPDPVKTIATEYFYSQVLSFLQPAYLSKKKFYATNNSLYFLVVLRDGADKEKLVALNIPSDQLPRFFSIDAGEKQVILFLEDIIRDNLHVLFKNEEITGCYTFKITRDAEIELKDEFPRDIARQFEKQLKKRDFGFATRFLYQPGLPLRILEMLTDSFQLENTTMVEGGVYHNLKDLFALPINNSGLGFEPWPAITYTKITAPDIFDHIAAKDILFHPPYQSYNTILRFFNEAAADPSVKEIFVTLYRVAANSGIVNALISAAKTGKNVVVMIELKARFDEANNLKWAKKLKAAGATIVYSVTALKVHAKLALVKREEDGRLKYYGLLGTGNFNEETAKLYTDHILMTANPELLAEVELLFLFLTKRVQPEKHDPINFTCLLVAKFNLQERFIALIDNEIHNANQGLPSGITIKLNNLEERKLISKLYEASAAGVPVKLIVRGVCCLIPGIKGISENIIVKRIVDRYLEHARVFIFNNNNEPVVYAGSADWMNRNIYRRIEVCFPILDTAIKKELIDIINLQLQDNVQAVIINSDLENLEIKEAEKGLPAQRAIYEMLKKQITLSAMKTLITCGIATVIGASTLLSCIQPTTYESPLGYDLTKPVKYNMPAELNEISGIAFDKGKTDRIYAEADGIGKVFYFKLGDKAVKNTEFKENGDFEDIAISNNQVVMLQSKGVLFTIPLSEIGKPQTTNIHKNKDILPEGEYEGMYATDAGQVYVLCKHCTIDKTSKKSSGFIFQLAADGSVKQTGDFTVNVKHIEELLGVDKISFHPSAITRSPLNNDWYILSSVNKILVVADAKWKIRQVYKLDQNVFTQPEGITFDDQNNLYISNEGHAPQPGNVLKFAYKITNP